MLIKYNKLVPTNQLFNFLPKSRFHENRQVRSMEITQPDPNVLRLFIILSHQRVLLILSENDTF